MNDKQDRQDNMQNQDIESTEIKANDTTNEQDHQKSRQDPTQGYQAEEKNFNEKASEPSSQKESAPSQESDLAPQDNRFEKDASLTAENIERHSQAPHQQQYSCSYTPPYYVPNFTVAEPSQTQAPSSKNKWTPVLVAVLIVGILLTFTAGSFFGYRFLFGDRQDAASAENMLNVLKNDGSIKVNEKIGSTGYSNLSVSEVVELVANSVVEITTSQVQTDLFFNSYVTDGAGSGVLIGENQAAGLSYIITNQHVIDEADQTVVRLTDGSEYTAQIVCSDADVDIAVLTIPATGLSYATMGSSASLKVGEEVVAIGNPLGELGGTVTNGIISALDRKLIVDGHAMTLLQTNAAINPGNSGGGLFNMAGELIGIVNAKQADTGIEGLGFAIPIDVAWAAANDMLQYGYVTGKLSLGFSVVAHSEAFQMQQGNRRYTFDAGVYIKESNLASLSYYDKIVSINGSAVENIGDFYTLVHELNKGDIMTMVVSRLSSNGLNFQQHTIKIQVSFTEAPAQA